MHASSDSIISIVLLDGVVLQIYHYNLMARAGSVISDQIIQSLVQIRTNALHAKLNFPRLRVFCIV